MLKGLLKMGIKLQNTWSYKLQFVDSARLMVAHYQILLITLLKEPITLIANTDIIIINVKCVKLNTKIMSAVLNTQMLKMILYYTDVYVAIGIIKKSLMKT